MYVCHVLHVCIRSIGEVLPTICSKVYDVSTPLLRHITLHNIAMRLLYMYARYAQQALHAAVHALLCIACYKYVRRSMMHDA